MPSYRDLWPDKWLKAEHLGKARPTVAILGVQVEKLYDPSTRQKEPRLIAEFHNKTLRLILNKTQAQALGAITGTDDYTKWAGHHVVLSAGIAPNGKGTILISPVPDPPKSAPAATNGHDPDARLTRPAAQAEPVTETRPAPFPEDEAGDLFETKA